MQLVLPPLGRNGPAPKQEVCEMQNSTRYGRWTWKKWVAIYVIAAAIVYAIVYLLFFAHSGGGGGGGLY
jgi:hypothetical protein